MSPEKFTIFVAGSVAFVTNSREDAMLVLRSFQKIQELTYGLNGYQFDVELMISSNTQPNYAKSPGYLKGY